MHIVTFLLEQQKDTVEMKITIFLTILTIFSLDANILERTYVSCIGKFLMTVSQAFGYLL